jgi:aryl-alcohol dehydrogenase-like predicted oxidoreductase
MERIGIGTSDLKTSRIGLGTWAIGGWMWGGTDEAQAIATIRSAVERGVTLIDTAPAYGFGRSEDIVGKALAGLRGKVQIATKVGLAWRDGELYRDSRSTRIQQEIEDSLRRLRTDGDRSLSGTLARSGDTDRGNGAQARGHPPARQDSECLADQACPAR